ncbi:MAG: NADH-quinone oxidoreductase subunit NuoF [Chitinispirillaceae bacterium]|nr:NADH-quinone oxidoreductase subunit NuoF [Chitinispirillaceae bacterium]
MTAMNPMIKEGIESKTARYPNKRSALLPALDSAQRENNGFLSSESIRDVASLVGTTVSKTYGVATYYTMFNTKPVGTWNLQVDTNIPGLLTGAEKIVAHLEQRLAIRAGETTPDGLFTLSIVEDLGSCGTCPVIQVNDTYFENMTVEKTDALIDSLLKGKIPARQDESHWGSACNILLKNRGKGKPVNLAAYRASGGYAALLKARTMEPADIIGMVKQATVRGRGGAGFPAGMKWGFLSKNDPRPVYLICNADEGEPGTFKDRQIMQYDPHLLIEGMAIAARAIGSKKAFIYIRGEFRWIADILESAIAETKKDGILGDLDIVVHKGAGSYECGEETALIESLEGKRGCPRIKPPFPANVGLYGCPTIVNNVETLSLIPYIVDNGAEAFRAIGTAGNFGPKLFGISGHVNKPGVYEYPIGTPLKELLEAAGGVKGTLKAVIVGGLSVPILTAKEAAGLNMDFDSCAAAGTMLGSGGIIVMNDSVSIPRIALRAIRFYAHESCGQCTPCREGSAVIAGLLDNLIKGRGTTGDIDTIVRLCDTIIGTTLCPTGDAFSMPIRAMVRKFRNEFEVLTV